MSPKKQPEQDSLAGGGVPNNPAEALALESFSKIIKRNSFPAICEEYRKEVPGNHSASGQELYTTKLVCYFIAPRDYKYLKDDDTYDLKEGQQYRYEVDIPSDFGSGHAPGKVYSAAELGWYVPKILKNVTPGFTKIKPADKRIDYTKAGYKLYREIQFKIRLFPTGQNTVELKSQIRQEQKTEPDRQDDAPSKNTENTENTQDTENEL